MNISANSCPCCGSPLLRHIRQGELYWFCKSCWQEVPMLTQSYLHNVQGRNSGLLAQKLVKS